ncbi:hypothetical protein ALP93_200286 [Pseudomonas syringae pv. helianthi]|nr:hypothetical protein ALP93_200286 [Pseudomonas syringae pv. helianthi]
MPAVLIEIYPLKNSIFWREYRHSLIRMRLFYYCQRVGTSADTYPDGCV